MKKLYIELIKYLHNKIIYEERNSAYYELIIGSPVLGTRYMLTMRKLEDIVKYATRIKGNEITIGGGVYDVRTLSMLIDLQQIEVTQHESGTCFVFTDKRLPEVYRMGWASDLLFREKVIYE